LGDVVPALEEAGRHRIYAGANSKMWLEELFRSVCSATFDSFN
jgi:hypothetical protein